MKPTAQKYIAIVSPDRSGPCCGIGSSVDRDQAEYEARRDAAVWGFLSHAGIAVEISEAQYLAVLRGNPDAWALEPASA